MSTPIMSQARAVLNALTEGQFQGCVLMLEHLSPNLSRDDKVETLKQVLHLQDMTSEEFEYWIDWTLGNNQ